MASDRVRRVDPAAPDPEVIGEAAALLRAGGLVAFPTETVYGLGASALDPAAIARLYEAKGRPATNPVIVHVADRAGARAVAADWPPLAEQVAERFWPGPLTLVLPRGPAVPRAVTAGLDRVAVRVPAHPVALAILARAGIPVVAPSANPSTAVSPTTADHVIAGLGDRVDLVVDGGPTGVGIESTVLDLTGPSPVILRPGHVTPADLEPLLGPVALGADTHADTVPRASPGQMARHYAPRARLLVVAPGTVAERVAAERTGGRRVGALVISGDPGPATLVRTLPAEPAGYARALYAALHDLDDRCDAIVAEAVPAGPAWAAVRDRLTRAGASG